MKRLIWIVCAFIAMTIQGQIAETGTPEIISSRAKSACAVKKTSGGDVSVRTNGTHLIISRKGIDKIITPVEGSAGYIWASLSPDNNKIVFVAAGKGMVITDLEGNIISRPGDYESPSWFGNKHLVVQKSTDDGHQTHSSQILLITIDGKEVQPLTKPESLTFNPTGDAEANVVWYTTIDGINYQQSVKLIKP